MSRIFYRTLNGKKSHELHASCNISTFVIYDLTIYLHKYDYDKQGNN